MTEKFRKIVKQPERTAARIRRGIEKLKVNEYVRERRTDKDAAGITEKNPKLRDTAQIVGLNTAKWSAWLAAGGAQFLLTLVRWMALDNVFLRKLEKKLAFMDAGKNKDGRPKAISGFAKKYPNLSAHILWYFMLAAVIGGGRAVSGLDLTSDKDQVKTEKIARASEPEKFDDFYMDPTVDAAQWKKMLDAVHPYVLSHLVSSEGFIQTLYDDNGGRGTLTIGSGFTLNDNVHRNFAKKILGRHIGNGSSISIEENRLLVSAWLYQKVYPKIKSQIHVPMDSRLFVILAVAGYNKGENTYAPGNKGNPVAVAINTGQSPKRIATEYVAAFGGIRGTRWGGLPNKFGVLALYYLGYTDDSVILNAIAEAPYTIEPYLQEYNGRLLKYNGTTKTAVANGFNIPDNLSDLLMKTKSRVTHGTAQQAVKNYLSSDMVAAIEQGNVMSGGATIDFAKYSANNVQDNVISESDKLNAAGEDLFFAENYSGAIKKFDAALKSNPRNYIAYSNLSIAYYKMGKYDEGLRVVQNLIKSQYLRDMPSDIKGYTYFNAALCRTAMGDAASDESARQQHYDMAMKNLRLAQKFSGRGYDILADELESKIAGKNLAYTGVNDFSRGVNKIKVADNARIGHAAAQRDIM